MWQYLKNAGINRNPKTILRIMKKYELLAEIRRRKKWVNLGWRVHKYKNLLNRQFQLDRPNKAASHQTVGLVLNTIRIAMKAEKKRIAAELRLHSDQGFQYTSQAYFKLTQSYGITPSMSRRGNCYGNTMAENFFSILKTECIYRHKPKYFKEANEIIDRYIYFYNHERIQLKTGVTPLTLRHFA